jgi:hypothetical protein
MDLTDELRLKTQLALARFRWCRVYRAPLGACDVAESLSLPGDAAEFDCDPPVGN